MLRYEAGARRRAGLEHLLRVELTQARPGVAPALRTVGVGRLLAAGLRPTTPAHLAVGRDLLGDEAVALINYLVPRGCPLDPPRALRPRDGHGQGASFHPLRYAACHIQSPRVVACLVAHGARFAEPTETNWVTTGIWLCWQHVFNDASDAYRAEREAMIASCQVGQFPLILDVLDHPDPDPILFFRQILTLYLLVFQPPTWDRHRFLLRGDFITRHWWPPRVFDLDYYP